jgi:hypothetical protein
MDIESGLGILLLVALLVAASGVYYTNAQRQLPLIRRSLERKGATDIRVNWKPGRSGRGYHAFDVHYKDQAGKVHDTTCRVGIWTSEIYWKDEE